MYQRNVIATVIFAAAIAAAGAAARARVELDPDGLISVSTSVAADSVTVGQRFVVTHTIAYPDTLEFMEPEDMDTGNCRALSSRVVDKSSEDGRALRLLEITAMTLDLESAAMPELPLDFITPSGDTLRAFTGPVDVPVRHIAAQSEDLAPLKEQWEAPRSYWRLAAAILGALALAALLWWLWRRRRAAGVEEEKAPRLPADYVALSELTRIEQMRLLDRGEHKQYYTLVVDVVRRYLEERFGVDTMDRTTGELISDFDARNIRVEHLEGLLTDADLVKFAKVVPPVDEGEAALHTARGIVVATTPRVVPSGNGDEAPEAA